MNLLWHLKLIHQVYLFIFVFSVFQLCRKHHFGIKKPERITQAAQGQRRALQKTLSSIKSAAENVKPKKVMNSLKCVLANYPLSSVVGNLLRNTRYTSGLMFTYLLNSGTKHKEMTPPTTGILTWQTFPFQIAICLEKAWACSDIYYIKVHEKQKPVCILMYCIFLCSIIYAACV